MTSSLFVKLALRLGAGLLVALSALGVAWAAPAPAQAVPGFLVVAPDRGFVGNEAVRDEFDQFAAGRNAELVFATDQRAAPYLDQAFAALARRGAGRVVVAPLFLSTSSPQYAQFKALIVAKPRPPLSYAPTFGESYLAAEELADRFRRLHHSQGARVLVVGYGATDEQNQAQLQAELQRQAELAAEGFGFAAVKAVVAYDREADDAHPGRALSAQLGAALADGEHWQVVPFHQGPQLDSMMNFDAKLRATLPAQAHLVEAGNFAQWGTWLARVANQAEPLTPAKLGVVVLAHGSDFHWNQTMREAVAPLAAKYKVEFAFSMADQPTVERALARLAARGAKSAVIVRVFGLEASFKSDLERMLGQDLEAGRAAPAMAGHGHHGHGDHAAAPAPRIRTPLIVRSVGGVGDHPLFARALLDRAKQLSRQPGKDTVILVAHGSGSDRQNADWLAVLERLAEEMRGVGGDAFRAIRVATWREDWPDKRGPWIEKVRAMVTEARQAGGKALVIPARTNGEGFEREFLAGLEYELGEGFAPHPLFARWVEEQVQAGLLALQQGSVPHRHVGAR